MAQFFSRPALHTHPEPAQRLLGLEQLPPDSPELAGLLAGDPSAEIRAAAAHRCADVDALRRALAAESDASVAGAIRNALGRSLVHSGDPQQLRAELENDACSDALRAAVATHSQDSARRDMAIQSIRDEDVLVDLALAGDRVDLRIAAAERVQSPEALRKLADAAKNKDRGVAKLARQRLDALQQGEADRAQADAIIAQLDALAREPGPILTTVVELDRRWQVLSLADHPDCKSRYQAARQAIQERFVREQEEPRRRHQFEKRLAQCIERCVESCATAPEGELPALRTELAALREEARQLHEEAAAARIEAAEQQLLLFEQRRGQAAEAEVLVGEMEALAAGTSHEMGNLAERWQAFDPAVRTPALKHRYKAALLVLEQRRAAVSEAAQQESIVRRHKLHGLLHAAEQALQGGQLQTARTSAEEIRVLRKDAGALPKPTTQRIARLLQQLTELERWESFGQQSARVQLCERAEALESSDPNPTKRAAEVQKLRDAWKALDQQYAGVPKSLWQRFDSACEKAYAPAARHFAEQTARNKESRKRREEFIAAAALQAQGLPGDPPDWRKADQWLASTERTWREGELGSVDPGSWKKLDAQLKSAFAPLRDALSAARNEAKAQRRKLIDEATSLAAQAAERDAPSRVKALQSQWQEASRALPLARRDEQSLWQEFRSACDSVFSARETKRKEAENRKTDSVKALEDHCAQVEALAQSQSPDADVRRALRDAQEAWRKLSAAASAVPTRLQSRFTAARTTVEAELASRARSRSTAVWKALAQKEDLCEKLDRLVQSSNGEPASADALVEQWNALPALSADWEQHVAARRDAAVQALSDAGTSADYRERIEEGTELRHERLLELEIALGLETPKELQAERLALQMKKLKDRFKRGATEEAQAAGQLLLTWCSEPGVANELDRARAELVFRKIERS